jgi:hypothetical protein
MSTADRKQLTDQLARYHRLLQVTTDLRSRDTILLSITAVENRIAANGDEELSRTWSDPTAPGQALH